MNKKLFVSIIAVVALVATFATLLVGCNPYKWDAIGGGEPNADVVSNGGYYVQQGKYVYFINGYDTAESIDNTFGVPVKNAIVRAELVDGKYTNFVVVVPKQVYNQNAEGGFAIFGEWIYYATPNNEEDIYGNPSTTHTDFMRTKIDGSATQRIATINSRSSKYLFTKTRILVQDTATASINYFDFSGMKNNGSSSSAKGVESGVLAENVETFLWDMNSDYVYFTQTVTDDTSYEFCNTLNAIKVDGTDKKVLADKLTYLAEDEKENYTDFFSTKVFSFTLVDMVVESDGVALYYTKATSINSTKTSQGLFVNKVAGADFAIANEKHISKNANISTAYGLGYENGALVTLNSNVYLANSADITTTEQTAVIGKAVTIQTVLNGVVYYTDSTGGKIYAINLDGTNNEKVVFEAKFNTSWLNLELNADGDKLMLAFFNSDDYNYVHVVNILADEDSTMIGIINDADKEAIEKAEEEAAK